VLAALANLGMELLHASGELIADTL